MKKLATALLVAAMVISTVVPVAAQESATLTEAIRLAKSFFPTDSFKQFWTSQETYNGKTTYYLYWMEEQNVDKSPARLTVRVDAQRMLVTGYNYEPAYKEEVYPALPKQSKDVSKAAAEAFAAKHAPKQFAQMRLEKVEEPQIRLEKRYWPHSYTFQYIQYVNGIAFPMNNMWVRVNADTGVIQDYNLNWEDYEFPSPDGALTVEKAQEVFSTKGLKLVYLRQYSWRENNTKPYLAYILENGSSMQIDAFTGEITYGGYTIYNTSETKAAAPEGMGRAQDSFTPWELEEIETVAGLLTSEQAETIAREIVNLPEKAQLRSSRLMEDKAQNARFWSLEWEYMVDDYYVGASARLNAQDGEIQNFYFWERVDVEKAKPQLTYEEALAVARESLQKWIPAKYSEVELTSKYEQREGEPLPYSYSFNFERRVNGLPVVGDNISITVQHDKRITSLYTNWYNGEFPSADGTLTAAKMNEIFLSDVGLKLQYVAYVDPASSSRFTMPTIKLVYKANELSSYNFNPFTGKNIDYYGKEIVPVVKPEYSDVAGHWAAGDIYRLVELGLLRLEGPMFKPDEVIRLGDLLQMLADAAGHNESDPVLPLWVKAYSTPDNAVALWYGAYRGIITDKDANIDPNTPVTREMLAFYLTRMQGYSNAAALKGIWSAPYSDFGSVSAEYQGSVAIAHALGLLGNGAPGKFLPKDSTTRAQVAVVLSRMLNMTK